MGRMGLAAKERLPAPPLPFRHTPAPAARTRQQENSGVRIRKKLVPDVEKKLVSEAEKKVMSELGKKLVSELRKKVLDIYTPICDSIISMAIFL